MKKVILTTAVVMMATVGAVQAQTDEIHGAAGVTFDTKYVWRGITVFGSHGGMHPFVDLDLMGTGFGFSVEGHVPIGSGMAQDAPWGINELQRWDYTLYYKGMINPDDVYETRYMLGWRYFNYPGSTATGSYKGPGISNHGSFDLQELFAGLSFPQILNVPGLVPSYVILKCWPSNSDTLVGGANFNGGTYSGWAHVFMLDYGWVCPGLTADTPEQTINLHAETVFNDGVEPRPGGPYSDSDWTHFLLSASTDFSLAEDVVMTPGITYQHTMESSPTSGINGDSDILWASVKFTYKF
jgi:hypothetical protein